MALPSEITALLLQGHTLAARVPLGREGWHAWAWVRPVMRCGHGFQEAVQDWTRTRQASGPYDDRIERFQVRYVELSDWHLDDRWFLDMDIAIHERPIRDDWREVSTEAEVAEVLAAWGVDSSLLDHPARVGYPDPPRM